MEIPKQLSNLNFCRVKKGTKIPFEKDWTNKPYSYEEIQKFILTENYGVLCGYNDLAVIDCDNESLSFNVKEIFPETFSVKTGGGGNHFYYFIPGLKKKIILESNGEHLGEIQSYGTQVVGCGSLHPNGKEYELINNVGIKTISLEEINKYLGSFMKKEEETTKEKETGKLTKEIASNVDFDKLLSGYGLEKKGNNWNCPFHKSIGGMCLSVDREKGIFNCFHCGWKGNIISFVSKIEDKTIKESIEKLKPKKEEQSFDLEDFGRVGQTESFYKKTPFFYDEKKCFWVWNVEKKCYKEIDDVGILNSINEARRCGIIESKSRSEILNALKQVGRKKIPKDIKTSWIQFKDKVYDGVTGEYLFEATPEYFFSNPILHSVGDSEDTPTIDKLFLSWAGEEHIKELEELTAFCCVPEYFIHRVFFFFGSGSNGKSTFDNLITMFLGEHNITTSSLERIQTNSRFETAKFHKKLVVFMSETTEEEIKKSDAIKRASGQELISGEQKGKNGFDFLNYAKIIIPANEIPKSSDDSDGFYRRVKIIDFPFQFQKEKDVLSEIPEIEFENLAKKCLRIIKDLFEKRTFTNDGNFSDRRKRYQARAKNIIENFIDSECNVEDINESVAFDIFFSSFTKFLTKKQLKLRSKTEVGKKLRELGWETKYINFKNDSDGEYYKKLTVMGIKIKSKEVL